MNNDIKDFLHDLRSTTGTLSLFIDSIQEGSTLHQEDISDLQEIKTKFISIIESMEAKFYKE